VLRLCLNTLNTNGSLPCTYGGIRHGLNECLEIVGLDFQWRGRGFVQIFGSGVGSEPSSCSGMWHGFHTRLQCRIVHADPNRYTFSHDLRFPY